MGALKIVCLFISNVLLAAVCVALIGPLSPSHWIDGTVKDEWGSGISSAIVTAKHRDTGWQSSDTTGTYGDYVIDVGSRTGWFDMTVTKSGWHTKTGSVYKYPDEEAEKDFTLIPSFYQSFSVPGGNEPAWQDDYHSWLGESKTSAYYAGDTQRPSASCQGGNSYAEAKTGQYVTFTYDKPSTNRGKVTATAYGYGAYVVEEGGGDDATSSLKVYCEIYKGSDWLGTKYFTALTTTKTSPCVNYNWQNEQTIYIYYIPLVQGHTYKIYIKAGAYTRTLGGRAYAWYGDNLVWGTPQYYVRWKGVTVETVNT